MVPQQLDVWIILGKPEAGSWNWNPTALRFRVRYIDTFPI
jgi:hypothetical protein